MKQCDSFLPAIPNVTMIDYAKHFRDVNGDKKPLSSIPRVSLNVYVRPYIILNPAFSASQLKRNVYAILLSFDVLSRCKMKMCFLHEKIIFFVYVTLLLLL